ncbi:MAG: TetR/AcrR family transcriptional regulator C-terminal domain-containing protein [Candidatus Spyradocola sp.]|jgi:probable dihydroxyacetone kinase regulator
MPDSSITKKALADALKQLMSEKPLQKISVGDICERCNMNRKSFYYHFKDKYDLVNWIFYTEFAEQFLGADQIEPACFLEKICEYFYRNRAFYVAALEQEGQNSFSEYFADVMRPLLSLHYTDVLEEDDAHDFILTFYTDALLTALKRWLREGTMPPQRFVELVRRANACRPTSSCG